MLGIDTNVLLRLFAPFDNADQTDAARQFVEREAPVLVNPIVLAELVWTLRRQYKFERNAICIYLLRILSAPEFTVEQPDAMSRALHAYQTGLADFADYMIGELNCRAGCKATATFDQDALLTPELFLSVKA